MLSRDEAVKVQLVEAHKYVQQFMAIRITAFGTTVGFVGAILAVIYRGEAGVHARLSLWAFEYMILLFASQMLGAMGRAIWLFCAHMFMMERDLYGPGGNHQWIMANLLNHRYSSTYGLCVAQTSLVAALCPLCLIDLWSLEMTLSAKWGFTMVVGIGGVLLAWLTYRNMEPRRVIEDAVKQAIRNETDIRSFEGASDEHLGGLISARDRRTPYAALLLAWRDNAKQEQTAKDGVP